MGVVYKAEDTRLGRFVALKFLPENVATDPSALSRFRREAQAASKLNHSNICTIYDIGEAEGKAFIAMEFLDGQTLKQLISSNPVELDEMVRISTQVADGLEVAHGEHIIHRDIKPANIFVTKKGLIKILDFGLAKVFSPRIATGEAPTEDAVPAGPPPLTNPGSALGTVSYMSPEQVNGEDLDTRSDLFSFGIVLFEMTTGELPFQGEDARAVFSAILNKNPIEPTRLKPDLPKEFAYVITKALEKKPERRYQSAADMRADLMRLRDKTRLERIGEGNAHTRFGTQFDSGRFKEVQISDGTFELIPKKSKNVRVGWLIVLAILVLVIAAVESPGIGIFLGHVGNRPFQHYSIISETDTGNASLAAVSPDGKYILIAMHENGLEGLWLRNLKTNSNTAVVPPSTEAITSLSFSPDGNSLYFRKAGDNTGLFSHLYRAPLFGGKPKLLVRDVDSQPVFSPDGSEMIYVRCNNPEPHKCTWISANSDGGDEKTLLTRTEGLPQWLTRSKDGKHIAFGTSHGNGEASHTIAVFNVDANQERTLFDFPDIQVFELGWASGGNGLVIRYKGSSTNFSRGQLGYVSYPDGKFEPLTNDLSDYMSLSVSDDGRTLSTVIGQPINEIDLLPATAVDFGQIVVPGIAKLLSQTKDVAWLNDSQLVLLQPDKIVRVSLDGKEDPEILKESFMSSGKLGVCGGQFSIVVGMRGHDGNSSAKLWQMDPDGLNLRRLTKGDYDELEVCSRMAEWVYYRDGQNDRWMRIPLHGGEAEVIRLNGMDSTINLGITGIAADGTMLVAPIGTLGSPTIGYKWKFNVFKTNVLGAPVQTFEANSQAVLGNIRAPQFTVDGLELMYPLRGGKKEDNLWVQPLNGKPGHQVTNFTSEQIHAFAWSPDTKRLMVMRGHVESDVVILRDTSK